MSTSMTATGALLWRVHRIGLERTCRTAFVRCEGACRARLCPPPVHLPPEEIGCEPVETDVIVDDERRDELDRCLTMCVASQCPDVDTVDGLAPTWPPTCGIDPER